MSNRPVSPTVTLYPKGREPLPIRLLKRVHRDSNDCWIWTGAVNRHYGATKRGGYARLKHEGKTRLAHRLSYELFMGPIPEGLTLDHLCRVRNCINPWHMEPVTLSENRQAGWDAIKAGDTASDAITGLKANLLPDLLAGNTKL